MECGEKCLPEDEGSRWRIPAQRARTALGRLPLGQSAPKRAASNEEGLGSEPAGFALRRIAPGEAQKVRDVGEKSGMSCDAAQHPCVFVLDLALNAAMAEGGVFFGGRNRAAARPASGQNPWPPCPAAERLRGASRKREVFANQGLKRLAQQDEAGVGVLGACARLGLEGQLKAGAGTARRAWWRSGRTPRIPVSRSYGPEDGAV